MKLTDADWTFHARVAASMARVRTGVAGSVSFAFDSNPAERGRGFDWAALGAFESAAAHEAYQAVPAHHASAAIMKPHIADFRDRYSCLL